jgi:hypothetical protein
MSQMIIMNELARLGRAIQELSWSHPASRASEQRLDELLGIAEDELAYSAGHYEPTRDPGVIDEMENVIDPDDKDPYSGSLSPEQRQRINDLLGEWEEPKSEKGWQDVSFIQSLFKPTLE